MTLGAAVAVAAVIFEQGVTQCLVGGLLQPHIDGGGDLEAGLVDAVRVAFDHLGTRHLGDVGSVQVDRCAVVFGGDRLLEPVLILLIIDVLQQMHAPEHVVAAFFGAAGVGYRVPARRRLGQPGDHRVLRQTQLVDGLAVIRLRGGTDAIGTAAEVDLVQVQLQDLLLGQLALDAQRQEDLLDLADVGLLVAEKEVTGQLHGDGAAARALFAGACQLHRGAQDTLIVDPGMLVKAVILGGQEGLLQHLRDLCQGQWFTTGLAELCQQLSVTAVDPHWHL